MLGVKLKTELDRLGLKYKTVAKMLGVKYPTFHSYLQGRRKLSEEKCLLACKAARINPKIFGLNG